MVNTGVVADVQVTGSAVWYLLLAVGIPAGYLSWLLVRTSPRTVRFDSLSLFETSVGRYLWVRGRTGWATILAAATAVGGAMCIAANFLPMVTFTDAPIFPGDPLAGPSEHAPSARGLALALGLIIVLLALRRGAGGEGNTVPVTLILASVTGYIASLAVADYLTNSQPLHDRFAPTVAAGPGLAVLAAGAAIAWAASATDLAIGLRRSFRELREPPPPLPA